MFKKLSYLLGIAFLLSVISFSVCFAIDSTFSPPEEAGLTAKISGLQGGGKTITKKITSTQNWTVPDGVTSVEVWVVGGGGGGGHTPVQSSYLGYTGNGGGGGGAAYKASVTVTPGQTILCTVGAAGTARWNATNDYGYAGTNGGTSSFGNYLSATGGQPGSATLWNFHQGGDGYGGGGSNGDTNLTGGNGQRNTSECFQQSCSGGDGAGDYGGLGGLQTRGASYGGGGGGGTYGHNSGRAYDGGPGLIILVYVDPNAE